MSETERHAFASIPHTAKDHFVFYLYAGIYGLINRIHLLSNVGGPKPEAVFERYIFLARYYDELRKLMPEKISWGEGVRWWRDELQSWEEKSEIHLPIRALASEIGLEFDSRIALMTIGLVEEDSRFGTLFAELQLPLGHRRPSLEFIGHLTSSNGKSHIGKDSWTISKPLIRSGLVEVLNQNAARSEWVLRVPPMLWDALRGQIGGHAADDWAGHYRPDEFPLAEELIYPDDFIGRLKNLPALIRNGNIRTLVLRSDCGSDPLEVIGAVAGSLNCGIVLVDGKKSMSTENMKLLGPYCTMTRSIPVIQYELGPGETISPQPPEGYKGMTCFMLGFEGGLDSKTFKNTLTLTLPLPDSSLRKRYWQQALKDRVLEDIDNVTDMFHLSGDYIRQVANISSAIAELNGRNMIVLEDIKEASRSLNRQQLDALADYIEAKGSWYDLVATGSTTAKLQELELRCRNRERLLRNLGPAFFNSSNRGVRALFTGMSGTGKTLAARILAAELDMDIYRVDIAAIINKYIGETEKNLHRILSKAEALDVVLLLDEGDSLLGSRTDVKSANDRYANLETNYLLQRLENYQGIILVTTNLSENVDRAFQRRMDIVVPFFMPQPTERLRIFEIHLPVNHSVEYGFLERVASSCVLTGGQIRNAVFHATLLALDEGRQVDKYHLEKSLLSEYQKAGSSFPLADADSLRQENDGGMETFINALHSR